MAGELKSSAQEQAATQRASQHLYENVEAVAAVYERVEKAVPLHQRGIELIVALLGRPWFFYCYVLGVSGWIVANLVAARPFDQPPFFWLQGIVTTSSLLTTIVVLITQNRQGRINEQRAHLDLQVNFLAERKIAKIISLLEELRRDSPTIKDRFDSVASAMERPADPQRVVEALESQSESKR